MRHEFHWFPDSKRLFPADERPLVGVYSQGFLLGVFRRPKTVQTLDEFRVRF
jgi:hypothetical protein